MKKVNLFLYVSTIVLLICPSAFAAISFSEDFESYAGGSNLSGQGGWAGDTMYVGSGTYMSGSVLDGRDDIGSNIFSSSRNDLGETLDASGITTLKFDAYATSNTPITHATGVGLDNAAGGSSVVWFTGRDNATGLLGWSFELSGLLDTSTYVRYAGGYDDVVTMGIVVDGIANEIYGIYDFGSGGTGETPHYSVTDAQINELNAAVIYVDYRPPTTSTYLGETYAGGEFDNITVIPEPATALLLGLGGMVFRRRRKA